MMILLDDLNGQQSFFPFGVLRSIVHSRVGILTIFEKWNFYFPGKVAIASEANTAAFDRSGFITFPGNLIPSHAFLLKLNDGASLIQPDETCKFIERPWHLFQLNDWAIRQDYEMITFGRNSQDISAGNQLKNASNIFVEEGAKVNFSMINAASGPVYIGKNGEVMEGCMIRGPFALGQNAVLKMGTKIYGATTIGPGSMAGGEIKNSILMAYSNKAHDGYLGDSVLGEWCNLGAGTSNSNLKNNVSSIKIWNKASDAFEDAGIKCGLLMGDYSRSAINTSFNTGTVAGICCNIFGNSFPPKFIDNFSWGNEKYSFEKVIADIKNWKQLKGHTLTDKEVESLKNIYQ